MSFSIRPLYKSLSVSKPVVVQQTQPKNYGSIEEKLSFISFEDTPEEVVSVPVKASESVRQSSLMSMARGVTYRSHQMAGAGGIKRTHTGIADSF